MTLQFGAYAPPAPWAGMDAVLALEADLGRRLDLVGLYQAWGNDWGRFSPEWLDQVTADGREVLLTWEPWDVEAGTEQPAHRLARIRDGAFDDYVRGFARGLAPYGSRVHLRPMHEMNGDWYPWSERVNGNHPGEYVAAWRALRRVFAEEGADGVRWVWSPHAGDVPAGNAMEDCWPGDDAVDAIGLDGYNWGAARPDHGGWRRFREVFGDTVERVRRLSRRPVWVTEVGCAPEGGDKVRWVADMVRDARRLRLEGIVWFHADKERDWRLPPEAGPVLHDLLRR